MSTNYSAIPDELKQLKQWCCWKLEPKVGKPGEYTKPPRQISGELCDVTNSNHYATFEEVVAIATKYEGVGIGFIFTKNDPYCGIDLDYSEELHIIENQKLIFEKFDSYSERSVSGKGLHIIIRAEVPSGRRRDKVELYSSDRFFAMTGSVYRNAPIAERQELASLLWEQMKPASERSANNLHK